MKVRISQYNGFLSTVSTLLMSQSRQRPLRIPMTVAFSSSRGVPSEELINTLDRTVDWDDRIGLQDAFSLKEKGWQISVEWRATPFGAGLFASQDVPKGAILRKGILGVNLIEFTCVQDIDSFCQKKGDAEILPRRAYVKDYLWGFNKNSDARGYLRSDVSPDWFFGMWIPGNGLNHNAPPNTVYVPTLSGIDLVAIDEIKQGDELFDDYRRHGTAPAWLKEFSRQHKVTLNFADCNDFVELSKE